MNYSDICYGEKNISGRGWKEVIAMTIKKIVRKPATTCKCKGSC